MGQGHKQTQSAQGTGGRRAAKSGNESGIRRRFGRTRRSGFAAVGSGLQGVRRPPPSQAQPLIPRLDDGFCWLTDDSSLEFRQGTISQSTGTISPAQFRHTISAFHCEVIHRGVRRLPCDNKAMVTNATIEALLGRRSIRKFKDEAIDDDTRATLETVAQHAASSQFLNDWSAIRVTDPDIKNQLAHIGGQPYIAQAPLLYVFVLDEHRNAAIARSKGVETGDDAFTLTSSYRYTQAQNDAVLALHAMETAAYSLGLGCVVLGSILNDAAALVDLLGLPEYTYPVLGLAIGKPGQEPALKPRMPRSMQFFENEYPSSDERLLSGLDTFDDEVRQYYDLRNTERPVDAFSDQIAVNAVDAAVLNKSVLPLAQRQGFRLDR